MTLSVQCLCFDSEDPGRIARFWAAALGWRVTYGEPHEFVLEPPAGSPEEGVVPDLLFLRVPEGKVVKNRLHLDLISDTFEREAGRLLSLGARRLGDLQSGESRWTTFADIEGNEFDLIAG